MAATKKVQLRDLFIAIAECPETAKQSKDLIGAVVKDMKSQGVTMDKETLHQDAERILGDHLTKLKMEQRDNPLMPNMIMYSPETAKETNAPLFVINMTHKSLGSIVNYLREKQTIV